jgi:Domain of unknown function (DUF4214)
MTWTQGRLISCREKSLEHLEARALLASIPIFSTGVDANHMDLALGSPDSHFTLINSPNGALQPTVFSYLPSAYASNSGTSQWIGPAADPFTFLDPGFYTYQETFDLTGFDPTTAVIQGQIASYKISTMSLNGVATGVEVLEGAMNSPSDFYVLHAFTLTKGFVPELNTLDVTVSNDHFGTGLRLDLSGTANTSSAKVVSGTVYLDVNADGSQEAGEPGLADRVVFLDLNHNGILDPDDPTTTTNDSGHFVLQGIVMGAVSVLEAPVQDADDRYVVDESKTEPDGSLSIGVVPISPVSPVPVVPNPFTPIPSNDANSAYVASLYRAVLGRVGGLSEVSSWVAELRLGMTRAEVAEQFVNSIEHRQDEVYAYYEEFLHRAPDPTSIFWVDKLMSGVSEEKIVEAILDSPEYQAAHKDTISFVQGLFTDVLGRVGDATSAAWVAVLNSGTSRGRAVVDFVESNEAFVHMIESLYTAYLHRNPEYGTTFEGWWTVPITPGESASEVATDILTSPEFLQDATHPMG